MAFRLLATLLSAALLAGCASAPSEEGGAIGIHGSAYDPSSVTVQAGEHVRFTNHDSFKHSVTADSGGAFDQDLEGKAEAGIDFPDAGTFAFHCKYHPAMRGTVVVQ